MKEKKYFLISFVGEETCSCEEKLLRGRKHQNRMHLSVEFQLLALELTTGEVVLSVGRFYCLTTPRSLCKKFLPRFII